MNRITCPILALAALFTPAAVLAQDVSLRLPWILNVQAAGYVMAKEKGFYNKEGLTVEILPGGPNLNSTALVATGANTFGTNDTNGIILGINQGMDLVMVGACFQRHPAGVISLASSGINEPADLVGKTLAYNEGGPWTLTKAMLRAAGVEDGVTLVVSPSTEVLINGDVDAKTGFTINEPIAIELAGKKTSVMLPSDFGIESNAEVIFTTRSFVKDNPETVRKFLAATIRGYAYAYANQAETVKAVVSLNNQLEPVQQAEQLRRQESYIFTDFTQKSGVCAINPDAVSSTLEMLNSVGGLSIDLEPSSLFTADYLP